MGRPAMSASGFPGKRVEASLAGMMVSGGDDIGLLQSVARLIAEAKAGSTLEKLYGKRNG
ncbi:hypothetical protein APE01nite_03810 [Acetobacter peroxydans]|uniref:Uncharacterized protein n=2 Tax=Acetobacteraceae TaxID=433 RepID=A0A4Y3TS60_9PROT|nr:hypothetical protein [Acetobacter peroxydans]GBR36528.1 hypothetical protein AA13755_1553 [Acetobacter peroxydans NBRC 13755]GBR42043.1 hypothetical protein AA0475_1349 [Acetobacter peroxydans]GEB84584.1 hypothetical protein APE01nite_03810 [Acetobacter peroxydans]